MSEIVNPITKRTIKVDGAAAKKLYKGHLDGSIKLSSSLFKTLKGVFDKSKQPTKPIKKTVAKTVAKPLAKQTKTKTVKTKPPTKKQSVYLSYARRQYDRLWNAQKKECESFWRTYGKWDDARKVFTIHDYFWVTHLEYYELNDVLSTDEFKKEREIFISKPVIYFAILLNYGEKTIRWLLKHGADVNAPLHGKTPIQKYFEKLMTEDAYYNKYIGETYMDTERYGKGQPLLRVLIDNGVNVNEQPVPFKLQAPYGSSGNWIMLALKVGNPEAVDMIMKAADKSLLRFTDDNVKELQTFIDAKISERDKLTRRNETDKLERFEVWRKGFVRSFDNLKHVMGIKMTLGALRAVKSKI